MQEFLPRTIYAHINGAKKTLFSPTNSTIRSPTIRAKRSITSLYFFTFVFMACTAVFLFASSDIHGSSAWLKSVIIRNRSQLSAYFPRYLFPDHALSRINENNSVDLDSKNVENETRDSGKKTGNDNINLEKTVVAKGAKKKSWVEMMSHCDIFDGKWVKDESGPMYLPGSCPLIDEAFDCYRNGRPDRRYAKLRWQPRHCNIPRLDGGKMLRFLRGKRIVYVGDSLNRNMWESMVCLMRNSLKDKSRVFEASGKVEFKNPGAYSIIFPDYNVSVEYVRSSFLVQEWEMPIDDKGSMKETLRLDMIEKSYEAQRDADVLVFNTGNWWTHAKTSQGKAYYQEGNRVHEQLDVVEALDKAMTTWARWVEANINPIKTHVFFRGYSLSHFSKGEWNTGGRCDHKRPTKKEKDLLSLEEVYPPIPQMLDKSMERVKIPLHYLNITTMTNYRRDAHPSIYRKINMTEDEKHIQDCSHWCLPGVPDVWNQLMFAQLLLAHKQRHWDSFTSRSM